MTAAKPKPCPLTPHELRAVGAAAFCTEATIKRYLRGDRGKPSVTQRLERALTSLGHGRLVRGAKGPALRLVGEDTP